MLPSKDLTAKWFDKNHAESHDGREVTLREYVNNHHVLDDLSGSSSTIICIKLAGKHRKARDSRGWNLIELAGLSLHHIC